jgi:hypothetical protein
MAKRKGNPNWVKGVSGNPSGRAAGRMAELEKAMAAAAKKYGGKTFLTHLCEIAYKDNQVAIAIARKLLPDLKAVDARIIQESPVRLIIDLSGPKKEEGKNTA